jgi:branched-chain amino acid transport system substrate-binding protein
MVSRRSLLQSSAAAACLTSSAWPARAANAPGVTDTEIKFGQCMPYSGPASAYSMIGRTEAAYFKMINETSGVNGRKLNFISLDDAYSPPKTVEQTRRLVEQEHVAFIFQALGGVTNAAIRPYLNDNKVPQLFCAAASDSFADTQHYPWTIALNPGLRAEAQIYARHILATKPRAKIGILYQNDAFFGKPYVVGLHEGLGAERLGMIVKEVSYEVTDPTVDSQIVSLQQAGVDTLIIAALPKASAQAIRKGYDIGWRLDRYISYVSVSVASVLKPAGLEKSAGLISSQWVKDPTDTRWKDDPGYKEWERFALRYMSPTELVDANGAYGFNAATLMVHVLKQCGDDLSRENIMRQALNIKNLELPMLLPGIKFNTSPTNYYPARQTWLTRFNGENWELFGELMTN